MHIPMITKNLVSVGRIVDQENYVEAEKDVNCRATMEEAMRTLVENETWDLVDASKGVKPIKWTWVYKVKYKSMTSSTCTRPDWCP